jgi:hypothetical protein
MARMGQAKEVEVVSDSGLVRVAREGDAAILGLLLERHRVPLYGLADAGKRPSSNPRPREEPER